jgi:cytochrome c oxidase assembly protein subunit 15
MSTDTPEAAARLATLFARMALAAAALTFVVIVASAFMRHTQAGLSCADWPACYATLGAPGADAVPSAGVHLARIAHRLAATSVLALVIGLLLIAWTQKPAWRRAGGRALAALTIAGALAVLGIITPGARIPAVALSNLLGGYAMLAALVATHAVTTRAPSPSRGARAVAALALAFVFVQAALGGTIGVQFASLACPALGDCGAWTWREFLAAGALDPLRPVTANDGRVIAPAGAAGLHVLHRICGLAAVALVLATAMMLRQARPRLARTLAAVVAIATGLGLFAVSPQPALPVVVAHNACAAILVALLAAVSGRSAASRPGSIP